ncbi:MAG: CPBP family intramembrane glutamic endopeptidase [Pirellulales bacterium]
MRAALEARSYVPPAESGGYWHQSRRPLTCLLFVLPLLACYEVGMVWLGPGALRNGADVWLQQCFAFAGLGGFLLLPFLTISVLLGWHHVSGQPWRASSGVLYTMAAECSLFAMLLVVVAHLHAMALSVSGIPVACDVVKDSSAEIYFGHMVRYCGAGIYEELLFRLMLIPLAIAGIGLAVASRRTTIGMALVSTSVLFSLAHYIGPHGESFLFYTFAFRCVAGCFFAVLFVFRGFGIAAGTHALYDILVGLPPNGL